MEGEVNEKCIIEGKERGKGIQKMGGKERVKENNEKGGN